MLCVGGSGTFGSGTFGAGKLIGLGLLAGELLLENINLSLYEFNMKSYYGAGPYRRQLKTDEKIQDRTTGTALPETPPEEEPRSRYSDRKHAGHCQETEIPALV